MGLKDSTVAGLCLILMLMALLLPLPAYTIEYEGIDNDLVFWSCGTPLISLAPAAVDLDEVRAELLRAELQDQASTGPDSTDNTEQSKIESRHPQCAGLARTQVVFGLLSGVAGIWRGRRWWVNSADARAEKKFKRLHEQAGKPGSRFS